jgi:hypothetical protein
VGGGGGLAWGAYHGASFMKSEKEILFCGYLMQYSEKRAARLE